MHRRSVARAFAAATLVALVATPGLAAGRPVSAAAGAGADTVDLTLLATNDLHRRLAPIDGVGGAAHLAGHLAAVRDRAPDALHVDAGDLTGSGSTGVAGVSTGYADEATVDVMNAMGLDVTTAGNHEFDAGADEARRIRQGGCWMGDCSYRGNQPYHGATFTTLAANVRVTDTGETIFPAWTIREAAGVKVGFVGATATTLIGTLGNDLLDPFAPSSAVAPAVEEVRAAGAEVVVLLYHDGSKQAPTGRYDVNGCEGISGPSTWVAPWADVDLIVDGHTHEAYVCDFPDLAMMTQASHRGLMYTEITLTFDRAAGEVVARTATNRHVTHDVAPDPEVAAIVERYRTGLDVAEQPAAEAPTSHQVEPAPGPTEEPAPTGKGNQPAKDGGGSGTPARGKK